MLNILFITNPLYNKFWFENLIFAIDRFYYIAVNGLIISLFNILLLLNMVAVNAFNSIKIKVKPFLKTLKTLSKYGTYT